MSLANNDNFISQYKLVWWFIAKTIKVNIYLELIVKQNTLGKWMPKSDYSIIFTDLIIQAILSIFDVQWNYKWMCKNKYSVKMHDLITNPASHDSTGSL